MRRLPVQVLPQFDEVFLSWFVRLAHAHGERVQSLAHQLWGRKRMMGLGSVFKVEGANLDPVSEATGLSPETIRSLTMESLVGLLWNEIEARGARKWVLPTLDKHRKTLRFGQQVCPGCLRDDAVPYFRKSWRLAFHTICPVHRNTLIDRCPCCGAPIILERLDIGMFVPTSQAVAYRCWKCGADLREAVQFSDVDLELSKHQMLLLDCLRRGWINVGGRVVYSTQFFEGLWILWSFLDDNRWSKGLGIDPQDGTREDRSMNRQSLSHTSTKRRRALLEKAGNYLNDWPDRLVHDMSKLGLSGGKLFRFQKHYPSRGVPFWLWEPVHLFLDGTMYIPSDAEVLEVVRWVFARDGFVRANEVARLLNMRTRSNARVFEICRTFSGRRLNTRQ
ncbi:MAG: TniQ family protein [Hydrogenophaga sp.]|nr:TniQ family protein [Hydrogenophaga sp.]